MSLQVNISCKINNLMVNYGKMLACYFIFFLLLGLLRMAFPSFTLEQYQQTELFEALKDSPWKFILMALVIAPILEEAMFRSLIKPSKNELILFICAWLVFFSSVFIPLSANWILKYSLSILSTALIFIFLKAALPERFLRKTRLWLGRRYVSVWLLSASLFGLVHIWNYVDHFQLNLPLFLLIAPRIIAGFFFGKIKIENNSLAWSIAFHSLNNALVVLFSYKEFFSLF